MKEKLICCLVLILFLVSCQKSSVDDLAKTASDMKVIDVTSGVAPAAQPSSDKLDYLISAFTFLRSNFSSGSDSFNLISFRISQLKYFQEAGSASFVANASACQRLNDFKTAKTHGTSAVSYARNAIAYLDKLGSKANVYLSDPETVKSQLRTEADNIGKGMAYLDNYLNRTCS